MAGIQAPLDPADFVLRNVLEASEGFRDANSLPSSSQTVRLLHRQEGAVAEEGAGVVVVGAEEEEEVGEGDVDEVLPTPPNMDTMDLAIQATMEKKSYSAD